MDDLGDHRPGRRAAADHGVRSPLIEAGLTKDEIRALSQERGLPTWDKPAMACLSSRIPYGSPVTIEALDQIEAAEVFLRSLGLRQLRVRHHGQSPASSWTTSGMAVLMQSGRRSAVVERFKQLGFAYVTLDLAGFRSGSMNEVIGKAKTLFAPPHPSFSILDGQGARRHSHSAPGLCEKVLPHSAT